VKLFVCIFLLLISCESLNLNSNISYANATYYARIIDSSTCFYSSANESDVLFYLPETYFVELLSSEQNFYHARYNDQYGYVKKEAVKPINGVPQNPFLTDISFRIFVPSGANLRSSPEDKGATNLVYSIPFLDTNLLYYGIAMGEEAISKKGTTWYFCKYYVNNLSYTGYVYAPLCDCLTEIKENTEVFEFIENDIIFEDQSITTGTNVMNSLSETAQIIIIIVVSLPCLLFIYLLFKPTKMVETTGDISESKRKTKQKKKISKLKHSDYFEFNDDDFN